MWGVVLASCLLVACRPPAPAEPRSETPRVGTLGPSQYRTVAAPRFDLDVASLVPDPEHHGLRWPLSATNHPKLEPGYPIAATLAQPGVTWIDLCNRGAHKRRLSSAKQDPIAYLAAWCHVLVHDLDAAIAELEPLQRSTIPAIARTIHVDLANILVSEADGDRAEALLVQHKLDRPELFDVLAATYADLGKTDDALVLNARALESTADAMTRCHRLARHVLLGESQSLDKLGQISDPRCQRLHLELLCWHDPRRSCGRYFLSVGIDPRMANLVAAYYAWPMDPAGPRTWLAIAHLAHDAIPVPNAADVAVTAIEAALRGSRCHSDWVVAAKKIAIAVNATILLHGSAHPRLREIIDEARELCFE